ncbi:hypothetical protein ACLOAV_006414 [Pseudogymnoascus australis]
MPPSTPQREVIEIPDSPTAHPEVIEISDDEDAELSDWQANPISIPHIKLPYEPGGDDDPECMKSELVDTKSYNDRRMVSPGSAMSLQSLSLGHGQSASGVSCLDVLDRELGEISREIEEGHSSMVIHAFEDAQFKSTLQPTTTGKAGYMTQLQGLEPPPFGGPPTASMSVVHHVAKKSRPARLLTARITQAPTRAVPKYKYYTEIERSVLADRTWLPPEPSVPDNNSKEDVKAARLKSMLLCAELAKQSRERENMARIGEYLPQIRSAYQDCRNCPGEEGIYESLDHKDAKHPSYHVELAFGISLEALSDLETPAAKLEKPTVSPDPLAKTLERYARESCLICSAHQCHIHGEFNDDDEGGESDATNSTEENNTSKEAGVTYQLYSMPHTRMGTQYRGGDSPGNESQDEIDSDSDCSEQSQRSYCSAACHLNPSNTGLNNEGDWTTDNHASMEALAASMRIRINRKAACLIAPMLGKSCSEVYCHLQKLSSQRVGLDDIVPDNGRRSKKFDWRDLDGEHKHDKRLQPTPCYHPGQNCFAAGKKCTCGKKVLVGESSVEGIGNGLYLAEPVQKDDFIAEYVGEIIGDAESNRRGALLKGIGVSYNFTLNAEMTIDAMWFGNATRFINHSEQGKNCEAKVLLVNSEHRIAFFATKKMNAGEELFFDYGKEFQGVEKLKEGATSSNAGSKSVKEQRAEPLASTIADTEAGIDEDNEPEESDADWFARTYKKRVRSDDDEDYIERGFQQGPRRARPALRNRRGRR